MLVWNKAVRKFIVKSAARAAFEAVNNKPLAASAFKFHSTLFGIPVPHAAMTNRAGWNNIITFYIKKSSFSLCKRT